MEGLVKKPCEISVSDTDVPKEELDRWMKLVEKNWDEKNKQSKVYETEIYTTFWPAIVPIFKANGWDVHFVCGSLYNPDKTRYFLFEPVDTSFKKFVIEQYMTCALLRFDIKKMGVLVAFLKNKIPHKYYSDMQALELNSCICNKCHPHELNE